MTMRFGHAESHNACLLCHTEKTSGVGSGQIADVEVNHTV